MGHEDLGVSVQKRLVKGHEQALDDGNGEEFAD